MRSRYRSKRKSVKKLKKRSRRKSRSVSKKQKDGEFHVDFAPRPFNARFAPKAFGWH